MIPAPYQIATFYPFIIPARARCTRVLWHVTPLRMGPWENVWVDDLSNNYEDRALLCTRPLHNYMIRGPFIPDMTSIRDTIELSN